MRFLIDENLPKDLVHVLGQRGHDVRHALDDLQAGALDNVVFAHAQTEQRILVTCDLDFSDIRLYPPGQHEGIILMRVEPQSTPHFIDVLKSFLQTADFQRCPKATVILENDNYRIRTENIF